MHAKTEAAWDTRTFERRMMSNEAKLIYIGALPTSVNLPIILFSANIVLIMASDYTIGKWCKSFQCTKRTKSDRTISTLIVPVSPVWQTNWRNTHLAYTYIQRSWGAARIVEIVDDGTWKSPSQYQFTNAKYSALFDCSPRKFWITEDTEGEIPQ